MLNITRFMNEKQQNPKLSKKKLCERLNISPSSLDRSLKDLNVGSLYRFEKPGRKTKEKSSKENSYKKNSSKEKSTGPKPETAESIMPEIEEDTLKEAAEMAEQEILKRQSFRF